MAAVITWTKEWSASDDGIVFGGADLQNIQTDIETYCVTLDGTQTITGNKTLSGTTTLSGSNIISGATTNSGGITSTGTNTWSGSNTFSGILSMNLVFHDNALVSYENELVYY